jgi:hypothetical protein
LSVWSREKKVEQARRVAEIQMQENALLEKQRDEMQKYQEEMKNTYEANLKRQQEEIRQQNQQDMEKLQDNMRRETQEKDRLIAEGLFKQADMMREQIRENRKEMSEREERNQKQMADLMLNLQEQTRRMNEESDKRMQTFNTPSNTKLTLCLIGLEVFLLFLDARVLFVLPDLYVIWLLLGDCVSLPVPLPSSSRFLLMPCLDFLLLSLCFPLILDLPDFLLFLLFFDLPPTEFTMNINTQSDRDGKSVGGKSKKSRKSRKSGKSRISGKHSDKSKKSRHGMRRNREEDGKGTGKDTQSPNKSHITYKSGKTNKTLASKKSKKTSNPIKHKVNFVFEGVLNVCILLSDSSFILLVCSWRFSMRSAICF